MEGRVGDMSATCRRRMMRKRQLDWLQGRAGCVEPMIARIIHSSGDSMHE
jgi:hypothetical protein